MKTRLLLIGTLFGITHAAYAQGLMCDLSEYRAASGLMASVEGGRLRLTWDGDGDQQLRLDFAIREGTPVIGAIAIKRQRAAQWVTLARNLEPDFRVASGIRRITNQQLTPLRQLGVEITAEIVAEEKWTAFWDAPLDIGQSEPAFARNPPPPEGVANQPGLPRNSAEINRATATYNAEGCQVKTNGARLEVSFPGMELGVFSGRLQYTVYKGTNLIRMEAVAKTEEPSVAYKYDAGLTGLSVDDGSRLVWRDLSNLWQDYQLGGADNDDPVPPRSATA